MSVVEDTYWDGENPPDTYIDFLGQEIRVGDYVVYASGAGRSSAKLTLATVDSLMTHDAKGNPYQSNSGYDYSVRPAVRLPGKPMWKMKVQPLRDAGWSWRTHQNGGGHKKVTLNNIDNVIKVDATNAQYEEYES